MKNSTFVLRFLKHFAMEVTQATRRATGAEIKTSAESSCKSSTAPSAATPGTSRPRLVERFDTVKVGIFQRKSANFRGLLLVCIEADFCKQILMF